jgi:hypothetical protein
LWLANPLRGIGQALAAADEELPRGGHVRGHCGIALQEGVGGTARGVVPRCWVLLQHDRCEVAQLDRPLARLLERRWRIADDRLQRCIHRPAAAWRMALGHLDDRDP